MSFFRFCWKNEKIDWPKYARTVFIFWNGPAFIVVGDRFIENFFYNLLITPTSQFVTVV